MLTIEKRPLNVRGGDNSTSPYTYNGSEQSVAAWEILGGTLADDETVNGIAFADGQANTATDVCNRLVTPTALAIAHARW